MKPFLVHYSHRDRPLTARVAADTEKEAEARFRANHPRAGDIQISAANGSPAPVPRPAASRPLVVHRPVNEAARERIVAEARRLVANLRAELFPERPRPAR